MRILVLPLSGLLALGLVMGTAGCSSDSKSSSNPPSTTAPEDHVVSDAKVAAGLATLGQLITTASTQSGTDAAATKITVDQAWNQWLAIEGRIKKNDTSAYLEFEDALSDMRIGADDKDATKVKKGATAIAALSATYLTQYPS